MIILTSAAVIVLFFFLDVTTAADPYVGCTRSDGYTEGIENADGECVNPATMKPFVSKPGLNFDCAIENKNMMATEAPGWAGKMGKVGLICSSSVTQLLLNMRLRFILSFNYSSSQSSSSLLSLVNT